MEKVSYDVFRQRLAEPSSFRLPTGVFLVPKGRPDLAIRIEPTISDRRGPPGSLITDLVVLTDSEDFQAALKQGVSTLQRVWRVGTTDQAAELLAAGRVGVLVIDTECVPRGAPEMITHLNL